MSRLNLNTERILLMADETKDPISDGEAKIVKREPNAVDPQNIFGDKPKGLTDEQIQRAAGIGNEPPPIPYQSPEITQNTPPQPGENLKEDAVNAPRDVGSAFNVRSSGVRAIPPHDP